MRNDVIRNKISWFYWIAETSILNSIVNHFDGSRVFFLMSLISINLNDSFCLGAIRDFPANAALIHFYGIMMCLVVSAIFVVFGLMGSKLNQLSAIAGFGLYSLDTSLIFCNLIGLYCSFMFGFCIGSGLD